MQIVLPGQEKLSPPLLQSVKKKYQNKNLQHLFLYCVQIITPDALAFPPTAIRNLKTLMDKKGKNLLFPFHKP